MFINLFILLSGTNKTTTRLLTWWLSNLLRLSLSRLPVTISTVDRSIFCRLKRKARDCRTAISARPVSFEHSSFSTIIFTPWSMAISTWDWLVSGRLEWQLSNFFTAISTCPVTLEHWAVRSWLIRHVFTFLFCKNLSSKNYKILDFPLSKINYELCE